MNMSEQCNELFAALAKAQAQMEHASKNSINPFFKSKYADFTQLIDASREALTTQNLCVMQRVIVVNDSMLLSTLLGHASGQWIESRMSIKPPKADVQSMGSYITYLKRYSYAALVGIATHDDDGEAAMCQVRNPSRKGAPIRPVSNAETITKEQLEQIEFELQDYIELAREVMTKMGISSLSQMPKHKFMASMQRIREIKQLKNGI